ncbi:hypothetical protein [Lichenibacterium ramalinae]|uniref:Uncharacterized protein n=1 Tax=Lichenibacterium ramalinae TaxID=2316527 RepID=A0A4Q2RDG7_9HYPH|nr:hypothetical protein [Lichenibacterium ramalinae]RYB03982.1 hypothetical protein D3272_15450 [Lichenibacterium ramalinae]
MSVQIYGNAPEAIAAPLAGATAFFYRYEVVGSALKRRKVADTRPKLAGEARLVDVLVTEDAEGRQIRVMRGILVPERDLARIGTPAGEPAWREFEVGLDVRLAIGRDLGVIVPRARPRIRLATLDGRPVAES